MPKRMTLFIGVHSKSTFVEGERGEGAVKGEQRRTGGGGPSLCVRSLFKKKCWDFQDEVL